MKTEFFSKIQEETPSFVLSSVTTNARFCPLEEAECKWIGSTKTQKQVHFYVVLAKAKMVFIDTWLLNGFVFTPTKKKKKNKSESFLSRFIRSRRCRRERTRIPVDVTSRPSDSLVQQHIHRSVTRHRLHERLSGTVHSSSAGWTFLLLSGSVCSSVCFYIPAVVVVDRLVQ